MAELKPCKCGCKDIELVEMQGTNYTTVGFKCKNVVEKHHSITY